MTVTNVTVRFGGLVGRSMRFGAPIELRVLLGGFLGSRAAAMMSLKVRGKAMPLALSVCLTGVSRRSLPTTRLGSHFVTRCGCSQGQLGR